ncbi:MAG: hypothetical protein HYR88_04615 [Verrucomicrobia bacterium]|nr:hypothetical protein [Verrucomicrobiota bacterium]MBI3867082.1 hypothetical protein [Verrucomicrobiota bacterium]
MNKPQKITATALAAFIASHFLRSYEEGSGFACFRFCWGMMLGENGQVLSGGWFYYSGFVVANTAFPILALLLLRRQRTSRATRAAAVVCWLQVFSWGAINAVTAIRSPSEFANLGVGYYVWLAAFTLLAAAHFLKTPTSSEAPAPEQSAELPQHT